jgi:Lrp/AsnC family transcriptional regulator, involved in the regulation of lysine biosynthesis
LVKRKQEGSSKIDDILLSILRQDARMSYTKVAQKLNLSESAVRRRISNLVKSGKIKKFTIEVDDTELSSALTMVSVSPGVPTRDVSSKLKGVKGVEAVYETAGQFDVAVLVTGSNIVAVNQTIEGIRRIEGVISTTTSMVLRTIR